MASNDNRSLASVTDGGVNKGTHLLTATYGYRHSESLYDVTYNVSELVATTVDNDFGGKGFAFIAGVEYSVDQAGHVQRYSSKPVVDFGARASVLGNDRSSDVYPSVTMSGGFMVATRTYLHEEQFHVDRYTISQLVRVDFVPETNSYFAFIEGTEYEVAAGSSQVYRLSEKPTVNLGLRSTPFFGDRLSRVDVIRVTGTYPSLFVTTRYTYRQDESYISKRYSVDDTRLSVYDANRGASYVIVNGTTYWLQYDGDSFGWNDGTIVTVPSQFQRPTFVVPSTNGGPPAAIPGRGPSSGPELNDPNSRPSTGPTPVPGTIPGLPSDPGTQPTPRPGHIPGIPD